METNETKITIYSGIAFNDPTGDLYRIKSLINSLLRIVDDMYSAWDDATRIDAVFIRQNVMQRLSESIESLMNLVQSADQALLDESPLLDESRQNKKEV